MELIKRRLEALRSWMKKNEIDAFVVPSTDPHDGEYVPQHWEARKWISGFTGSAGTFVITISNAAVWTDSRYFIQAEQQLKGTGIRLMKAGLDSTPTIAEYLAKELKPGSNVGFDGWCCTSCDFIPSSLNAVATSDPFDTIWEGRPELPLDQVAIQPLDFAGESAESKISRIRTVLKERGADATVLTRLDDIAWTLNLRGNDVHCNPVFISYLVISQSKANLFIDKRKITGEVESYLAKCGVECYEYADFLNFDLHLPTDRLTSFCLDGSCNYAVRDYITNISADFCLLRGDNSPIVPPMKAVKTKQEQDGFRNAMLRDGVALVRFEMWLEENVANGNLTEISIDEKLTSLRAGQDLFKGISFDTIAAYQSHGAIVHYEATPETDAEIKPEGLLLIDSGAQYQDGTTDITRTYALGEVTDEQKRDYTLVLKGHIALSSAVFPEGTCGTQLDVLARSAMWKYGINYLHGTGHGVGSYLNVHEGPHQIRMNHMPAVLKAGMTVTDEPGIYKKDKYGIRIENTLLITDDRETEFGKFLKFEPLTLCPIDKKPIVREMLNDDEIEWINNYHKTVYDKLAPLLNDEEKAWLANATSKI